MAIGDNEYTPKPVTVIVSNGKPLGALGKRLLKQPLPPIQKPEPKTITWNDPYKKK